MSTIRVDTASWISGAIVCGVRGLGVLGSEILATTGSGSDGPGILFADVQAGDEAKEFRALIETWPPGGGLFVYEDGTFIYTGARPVSFDYQGFADGVSYGSNTISIGGSVASGAVLTPSVALLTGAAFAGATAPGQLLSLLSALTSGDAEGGAAVQGQTLLTTASLVTGGTAGDTTASGVSFGATATLSPGGTAIQGNAAGVTLPTASDLVAGDASGVRQPTQAGATLTLAAALQAGSASGGADVAAPGATYTISTAVIAGAASGAALANGVLLTTSVVLLPGAAAGQTNAVAAGYLYGLTLSYLASIAAGLSAEPSVFYARVSWVRPLGTVPRGNYYARVPVETVPGADQASDNPRTAYVRTP